MSPPVRLFDNFELKELAGSTLVVPSVSVANIPQFVIDLLLYTYKFSKVAALDDLYLHPFASPVDRAQGTESGTDSGILTPVEVYFNAELKTTIIQQRSPIIGGFSKRYVTEVLAPFVKQAGFNKVVLLDSSDAGLRENFDPTSQIDFYSNEDLLRYSLAELRITEPRALDREHYAHSVFIKELIQATNGLETIVFVSHVYEGDNFNDARLLARAVAVFLFGLDRSDFVEPQSWLGVYGNKPVLNAMEDGLYC